MNPFRLSARVLAARRQPGSVAAADAATGAVEVPWRLLRHPERGVLEAENAGSEPLRAVRFALAGEGMLGVSLPRTVHPGERVRVVLRGVRAERTALAPDALLTLRWFEPDGRELLWPVAL